MHRIGILKILVTLAALLVPAMAQALPEFPFCPFGGPTGWYNRLFDDRDYYPIAPAYYPQPVVFPYWGQQPVLANPYSLYTPVYPPPVQW